MRRDRKAVAASGASDDYDGAARCDRRLVGRAGASAMPSRRRGEVKSSRRDRSRPHVGPRADCSDRMNPLRGFKAGSNEFKGVAMPRGGARPGSGPSADPNSARSKAKAAKAAKLGLVLASPPADVAPSQPRAQPAAPDQAAPKTVREQPLELMFRLMRCGDPRIELQAAIAAAPYVHPKFMPVRAKPEPKEKPASRFSTPGAPPRLVVNKP